MAGVLDSVNKRTQLVGQNRLELLLFKLGGIQRYGINVFKVKEVLQCPPLTSLPKLHPSIRGIANIRGKTISVIDMNLATGGRALDNIADRFIIITEYNRSVQGFLVDSVERIININWENILPPPSGVGRYNYLTAVTEIDGSLVEILDVEKILDEIAPVNTEVAANVIEEGIKEKIANKKILVADDSSVARKQIQRAITALGIECDLVKDGKEALLLLQDIAKTQPVTDRYALMISDVEMPEMDGYTLTANVKANPDLAGLHIILHTSLSGVFNQAMVEKVGADDFIAKFNPDELATAVQRVIHLDALKNNK
ncbi:chemotaxis protein [Psychromonas antarctica]|jgi:two-component system chemotaxis response regulator CheV|uniref:chemotaxis protein n=1 Tax=Psychromonas antarctica TaxID=67573 RepID=UPI001EE82321|nr:chemotaxis protein [Psychromonas antarctica]MCG6199766.1 chemotaxis protein [Psychromonas antarctica]